MKPMSWRAALVVAGLLGLGACSGAAPDAAAPAASQAPVAAAVSQPGASAGPVPTRAAPDRPAATTAPPSTAVPADATTALRDEILRLVGTASCRDDSQCRALPIGSKPCGGPEGYVAWSTASTDVRELEAAAARYTRSREQRNRELGLMSDCAVAPEPAVRCMPLPAGSGGRCETVRGPGGLSPGLR